MKEELKINKRVLSNLNKKEMEDIKGGKMASINAMDHDASLSITISITLTVTYSWSWTWGAQK